MEVTFTLDGSELSETIFVKADVTTAGLIAKACEVFALTSSSSSSSSSPSPSPRIVLCLVGDVLPDGPLSDTPWTHGDVLTVSQMTPSSITPVQYDIHRDAVRCMTLSIDGSVLVGYALGVVMRFDSEGTLLAEYEGETGSVNSLIISASGKWIFSAGEYGLAQIDITKETAPQSLAYGMMGPLESTPCGNYILCAASYEGLVRVYGIASGEVVKEFDHERHIEGVSLSPCGVWLGCVGDGVLVVWGFDSEELDQRIALPNAARVAVSEEWLCVATPEAIQIRNRAAGGVVQRQLAATLPNNIVLSRKVWLYIAESSIGRGLFRCHLPTGEVYPILKEDPDANCVSPCGGYVAFVRGTAVEVRAIS